MANKFTERKIEAEILGELYEDLERKLQYAGQRYEVVGKQDKQATDRKTGELLWEDDECTIPLYRDEYDYVDIPEAEMDEETRLKIKVIKNIMAKLEKM